jgi:hypothetical protein
MMKSKLPQLSFKTTRPSLSFRIPTPLAPFLPERNADGFALVQTPETASETFSL